jgi:hypothetical protein
MSRARAADPVPALFTKTSTPPRRSARSSTTSPQLASSEVSKCATTTLAPAARTSAAVSCAPASSMCQVTLISRPAAARATAVARPIPESEAVTMAARGWKVMAAPCPATGSPHPRPRGTTPPGLARVRRSSPGGPFRALREPPGLVAGTSQSCQRRSNRASLTRCSQVVGYFARAKLPGSRQKPTLGPVRRAIR